VRLFEIYPDLEPLTAGSSYSQLFNFLYSLALLRYFTKDHANKVNSKLGTKKKIAQLCELDYLNCKNSQVYTITEKTRKLLDEQGFNCKILAKKLTGEGNDHDLKITDYILDERCNPWFYSVIYPFFDYLIPDACLIYKNESTYKITFLEVENPKAGWDDYLENKKSNYKRLASDYDVYGKWWKVWSERLNIPYCTEEEFCFNVVYVKGE